MRIGGWLLCAMLGGWCAGEAMAGTLYRCESSDGSRSYSSKRVPGASCSAVAQYSKQRNSNWQPMASAAAATQRDEPSGSSTETSGVTRGGSATPAATNYHGMSSESFRALMQQMKKTARDGGKTRL